MGVISSRIRRHRRQRLAAEMAVTWTPRRLFPLGQEQGGVYYPDDPNALLRRVNLLSSTATLSTQSITATPRQQTLSFKGTGTVTLSGASTAGPLVGTGASDRVTLTFTPTAASLTLTVTGTVTEAQLELGPAFTTYQPVTTWTTDYMAAIGHLVTQFTDSAGTTPVTKVGDPVGLTLDRRFGGARGPEQITTQDLSNVAWFSGGGFFNFSGSTVSGNTITGTGTSGSRTFRFAVTPGEMVECTALATYISGTNAQLRITFGTSGLVPIGGATSSNTITSGTGAVRIMGVAPATAAYCEMSLTVAGASGSQAAFTDMSARVVPGNHRIQATSGSRKTLSARVNIATATEVVANSLPWGCNNYTIENNSLATGLSKPAYLTKVTALASSGITTHTFTATSTAFRVAFYVASPSTRTGGLAFLVRNITTSTNLQSSAMNSSGAIVSGSWASTEVAPGIFRVSIDITSGVSIGNSILVYWGATGGSTTGDYWYVGGMDLRTADDAAKAIPAYQCVNTASDYDTDGFPHYWLYDGTDDSDATASTVDGSASDKVTVIAGVTKLSDATLAVVAELTAITDSTNGSFTVTAQSSAGPTYGAYGAYVRGSVAITGLLASTYTAPQSSVFRVSLDTSLATRAEQITLRVNGAVPTLTGAGAVATSSGNFANAIRYHGRRGGSSLPANFREYAYIERFGPMSDSERNQAERWVAQRMGVTI